MKVISEVKLPGDIEVKKVPGDRMRVELTVECTDVYFRALDEAMQETLGKSFQELLQSAVMRQVEKVEETYLERWQAKNES